MNFTLAGRGLEVVGGLAKCAPGDGNGSSVIASMARRPSFVPPMAACAAEEQTGFVLVGIRLTRCSCLHAGSHASGGNVLPYIQSPGAPWQCRSTRRAARSARLHRDISSRPVERSRPTAAIFLSSRKLHQARSVYSVDEQHILYLPVRISDGRMQHCPRTGKKNFSTNGKFKSEKETWNPPQNGCKLLFQFSVHF